MIIGMQVLLKTISYQFAWDAMPIVEYELFILSKKIMSVVLIILLLPV